MFDEKMNTRHTYMAKRLILAAVGLSACLYARAEFVGFNIPIFQGVQSGYDFDGTNGAFSGIWYSGGPSSNGLTLAVDPRFNVFQIDINYPPAPWGLSQPSIAMEGFDWNAVFWVTNFTGRISGLESGRIVTIFFLYATDTEQMDIWIDGEFAASVTQFSESNIPSRLERYGWLTNGLPTGSVARVIAVSARTKTNSLDFSLASVPPSENTPTISLYGIVLDTLNESGIDNDQDGVPDWQEIIAGTDAFDSNSLFKIVSMDIPQGDHLVVSWSSETNRSYNLLSNTDLVINADSQLLTNIYGTPPMNIATISVQDINSKYISITVEE